MSLELSETPFHSIPSIVPLPFGSGYEMRTIIGGSILAPFNCAAPFRERLLMSHAHQMGFRLSLQLCRSLSGAVIKQHPSQYRR